MRKQTIKPMVLTGGLNQQVFFPSPVQSQELDSFTFGQWVNYSATSGIIDLLNLVDGDRIYFRSAPSNNSLYGYLLGAENAITATDIGLNSDGEMFVVMRYDNTQGQGALHFFANGVQVAELLKPSIGNLINTDTSENVFYNADANFHTRFFYSSALSDDQIKGLYNNGLAISASSLPRYKLGVLESCYALDSENEGIDLSGGGYHGSLVNSPTFDGSAVDTLHTGIQTQNTLKADGSQYLTGAKISEVGEDFFFSCFAKFDDFTELESYICNDVERVFLFSQSTGGKMQAKVKSSSGSHFILFQPSGGLITGRLYHFAMEVDLITLTFSFYVDGVLVDSIPLPDFNSTQGALQSLYASAYGIKFLRGSLRNIYFGRKAFGQQGVDWFYNKGVPRDLSIMPSTYANEAISIYEPNLLNGGADISGNGNDCSIVGTPAYTAVEEVQKISNYMLPQGAVPQDGLLAWVDGETKASNKADTSITVVDSNTTTDSINGVPAIGIDETNYIRIGLSAVPKPASFTTFVVARRDDDSAFSPLHTVCNSIGADATMWGTAMFNADSAGAYSCYHSSTTSALSSRTYHTTPSLINEPIVLTQRYTAGTNEIEIFLNGVKDSTITAGEVFNDNTGDAFDMVIGKFGEYLFNTTLTFKGAVGDFGIYDRAVSDEEMTKINDYLTSKYGI